METQKCLRRKPRHASGSSVIITWNDRSGHSKHVTAKILDCSEHGMRLELPQAVDPRTQVFLRSEKEKLTGGASVRHCRRFGAKFVAGLEFNQGVRWKAPSSVQSGSPDQNPGPALGLSESLPR